MRVNASLRTFAIVVFSLQLVLIPAPSIAGERAVAGLDAAAPVADSVTAPGGQPAQQMREHLQFLDRHLRLRLLAIADSRIDGRADVSKEEIRRFRRHLRSLEDRLHAWDAPEAAALLRKVRALEPLVDNLARAAENPEAAAGLADLRWALKVEWPPVPGLKAGVNDDCAGALQVGDGTYFGDTSTATPDGEGCYEGAPDVWFAYSSPATVDVVADTFGSGYDTALTVHTGCPGTWDNQIACNDDTFSTQSAVAFEAQAGATYYVRVTGCCGDGGATGPFTLNVGPGGIIAGRVTDAMTGAPVPSVELLVLSDFGASAGFAVTGPDGDYTVPGLVAGTYTIYTTDARGYLPEVYDDQPCTFWSCRPEDGTPITVVSGATTGGIDFALHRGGTISGTVTERATGNPIPDLPVGIWDGGTGEVIFAYTSAEGHYSMAGLWAGTYYATAESTQYLAELYDDVPCPGGGYGGCDPATGTPIEVSFDQTTGGIDFALERLGVIAGTVSDSATGFPIGSANVSVWDENGSSVAFAYTDSTGTYQAGGLAPGNYTVTTESFDYFDELYDDLPCEPYCDPVAGTPIAVSLNSTTSGIDFALERLGAIAGTVTHTQTGAPVDAAIHIRDALGNDAGWTYANAAGSYVSEGLIPGDHTAEAQHDEYRDELYDDIPCEDGGCDPAAGTPIVVALNAVTQDVDFALERMGTISGRVTSGGEPVLDALIDVYASSGTYMQTSFTGAAGVYSVHGLAPGNHFVVADGVELAGELYDGFPCDDGVCDPVAGTPVAVALNATTAGIDFDLESSRLCTPTDTSLCLAGDRFRVEATWEDFEHDTGPGFAEALTDRTGYFWFFGPDNIELVVKVLDACVDPFNHFWVFAAGLTDVGVVLRVTDELTGEVQTYTNTLGNAFQPILDTAAFATCDAVSAAGAASSGLGGPPSSPDLWQPVVWTGPDKTSCVPSTTGMCLNEGRFLVEALWSTPAAGSGAGQVEQLTGDSGYFWFFGPDNVEVVVKVLNACVDPFNHFWVFAAGLTDVEVVLRVTDTESGEIQEYSNPLGTAFQPILDTGAFSTCPP